LSHVAKLGLLIKWRRKLNVMVLILVPAPIEISDLTLDLETIADIVPGAEVVESG